MQLGVTPSIQDIASIQGGGALRTSFALNLLNGSGSLLGSGLTFTRASPATQRDFAGVMNPVVANELRFDGYRRVQNLYSGNSNTLATVSAQGSSAPTVSVSPSTMLPDGSTGTCLQVVWAAGGDSRIRFPLTSSQANTQTLVGSAFYKTSLTGSWIRATTSAAGQNAAIFDWTAISNVLGTYGQTVYIAFGQVENVTTQANQNPGEYTSTGVLPSPYYGAFVDGVQCFPYLNGNTVSSNVVTAGIGAAIDPVAVLKGANEELAATNYFLNSNAPATQTISLAVGTYIVWMYGTGSVGVALGTAVGTGTGTATNTGSDWYTSNSFLTLNITVAGTIVVTDTGSVTFVQVENSTNGFPTSPIITSGGSVTRAADTWTLPKANVPGYSSTQGWFQAEVILPFLQGVNLPVWGSDAGDTPLGFNASSDARTFNGTTATATANAATTLAVTKLAMSYAAGPTESVCLNAGTVASSANAFLGPTTNFQLYGGGARWTRKMRAGTTTLSAAQLQTVTGSTY